jgi:hypothetical protein
LMRSWVRIPFGGRSGISRRGDDCIRRSRGTV